MPVEWVKLYHPGTGLTATVARSAVPAHEARGWREAAEEQPEPDVPDESGDEDE